ncbi:MAG: hypothetical protein ACRDVW_07525, partial [Acidimicrobiales bacterium]
IAAFYGARHPEVPAVFNLDGHGPGDASLYDAMSPEDVETARSRMVPPAPAWYGSEGDAVWKATALAEARQVNLALGVPEEETEAWAARDFVNLGGGRWRRHPALDLGALNQDARMFDVYRRIESPLLIVVSGSHRGLPEEVVPIMTAYRRGLDRAFSELAAERHSVRVVKLEEADHNSLAGRHAADTVAVVAGFLTDAGYGPRTA